MSQQNNIDANDVSINTLLKDQKFYIDFFQREYRWEEKHIKALIEDLTDSFLKSYKPGDAPEKVGSYDKYFLGPVIFSVNSDTAKKSIIDGQQRITSITLLLIFLNHLQKKIPEEQRVKITDHIYSEKYRKKSFNMSDKHRERCLKALYEVGSYSVADEDDDTVANMVKRYQDIYDVFPDLISKDVLPFFIDWLIENVVVVEVIAYSDVNAYNIFETMNDRGLNLTSSEMLKGYVLSKITNKIQRDEINEVWKKQMQKLHVFSKDADQSFFRAWFRGKYAESIRPGKVGSVDKDFELIGSRFHSWFKDKHTVLFKLSSSDDFYNFFKEQLPFYVKWYLAILSASNDYIDEMPHLHYVNYWGIAESLQEPMLLAVVNYGDNNQQTYEKIDVVARYIETFTVRRSVNYNKFAQAAIKYSMFNIIKTIRDNDINTLKNGLSNEIKDIPQEWAAIEGFGLHGMNRKFVKHLLSRISSHIDGLIGKDSNYVFYQHPKGKQFEIEHIWADDFNKHTDEFKQISEFQIWRNSIGALILLPQGTNQSFSSDDYEDKLEHYLKENTYAQTLHKKFYEKNPNFLNSAGIKNLGFKPHDRFNKNVIQERAELVKRICEQLWDENL